MSNPAAPADIGTDTPAAEPAAPAAAAAAPEVSASWRDGLTDGTRNHPTIVDYKSPQAMVDSHIKLASTIGEKRIALPKDGWSEEQYSEYHAALGRPDSPEAYDFNGIMAGERQVDPADGMANEMRQAMFDAGVTGDQAKSLISNVHMITDRAAGEANVAHEARADATTAALKTQWGMAYDQNLAAAQTAGRKFFGGEEGLSELTFKDGSRAIDNQPFIEELQTLGALMAEDELSTGAATASARTPQQARVEIDSLIGAEGDPEFKKMYFDHAHPGNKAAQARVSALYKQESPEPEIAS